MRITKAKMEQFISELNYEANESSFEIINMKKLEACGDTDNPSYHFSEGRLEERKLIIQRLKNRFEIE